MDGAVTVAGGEMLKVKIGHCVGLILRKLNGRGSYIHLGLLVARKLRRLSGSFALIYNLGPKQFALYSQLEQNSCARVFLQPLH